MLRSLWLGIKAILKTQTERFMSRLANLLMLSIGIILIPSSFSALLHNNNLLFAATICLIGIGLIAFSSIRDSRYEKKLKENKQVEISRRISELTKKPWLSDQTLQVHRSTSMTLLTISMGIISAILIKVWLTMPSVSWPYLLGGLVFLLITVIALSRFYVGIGKPACEMNRNGFNIPIHGFIPWKEVIGIYLHEVATRGNANYVLLFKVENYTKVVTDIHWTDRMFGLFGLGAMKRGVVGVQLKDPKESPEVIYAVAKFLWKQATGFDYDWNPKLSDAYNDSAKQLGKLIANQSTDPEVLHDRLVKNPQSLLSELEKVNAHQTIVTNELNKAARKFRLQIWILTSGAIVFFLVRLYFLWAKHH